MREKSDDNCVYVTTADEMKEMNFREIECGNRFLRSGRRQTGRILQSQTLNPTKKSRHPFICGVIPDKVWKNGCAEYMSSASIIYSKFNRIQSI